MRPRPPRPEPVFLPDDSPNPHGGDGVVAHWHRPATPGPRARAGVVMLPIQGGDYEVSTMLASALARQGYHCLRFERRAEWLEADRDLADLGTLVCQYEVDIRRGIDWWLEQNAFAPERLGLMGVSMGAVMGSRVAAADPRIRASVFVIGGGDLAEILYRAHDKEIGAYRNDLAKRLGVSVPELRPLFHDALDAEDNLRTAGGMNAETTLFLAARFDRVVPWACSRKLWETIGRPRRRILPCGHYSTVVFVPYVKRAARRWFDRHLLG